MTTQLKAVLDAIDAANAADPKMDTNADGQETPAALLYGQRMSAELERLFGNDVSDVLKIACRGQHIERWKIARSEYPEGRAGYLNWRRDQGRAHADRLAGLMRDAGYPEEECQAVGVLLRKEGIKRNEDVQRFEDVICFVFLKWYFADFASNYTDEKVLDIVAKTARKMSDDARVRVLAEFDLPSSLADAVKLAA